MLEKTLNERNDETHSQKYGLCRSFLHPDGIKIIFNENLGDDLNGNEI